VKKGLNYLGIAFSGLLTALAFPKYNLYFLSPFVLLLLFFLLERVNPFIAGITWGMSHFILLLYWIPFTIEKYGKLSPLLSWIILFLLSFYLSLFYSLLFYVIESSRILKNPSFLKGIVLGLLWCGTEFLRASLFTGFSWGELGYLLTNFSLFLQFADIFGVWGLTFVLVLINYFLFFLFFLRNSFNKFSVFLFIIFFSFLVFYGIWAKGYFSKIVQKAPRIKVAILQGNVPQEVKKGNNLAFSINTYLEMFEQVPPDVDLVLTPETALPFFFPDDPPSLPILELFKKKKNTFVLGAFRLEKETKSLSKKFHISHKLLI